MNSKSTQRVLKAAAASGLRISVISMPESTRTAEEASKICGCEIGQIVKSLIFEGVETNELKLLLVSGKHDVSLENAKVLFGEPLTRANPKRVRSETGFAIGSVAPLGHLCDLETWMDRTLLDYSTVWAAAGRPNAIFETCPNALLTATGACLF